jgi:hypothetical protein
VFSFGNTVDDLVAYFETGEDFGTPVYTSYSNLARLVKLAHPSFGCDLTEN